MKAPSSKLREGPNDSRVEPQNWSAAVSQTNRSRLEHAAVYGTRTIGAWDLELLWSLELGASAMGQD
jgi:hypothetical protein